MVMTKVNKSTKLSEILKDPQAEKILKKYNLPCLSCPFAQMEMENLEIGSICEAYQLDLNRILKDLNSSQK